MKCFKKVAALLFCVALALSVMAVSAMAEGEPEYVLTLKQSTAFTHHDDDANQALEVSQNGPVAYDMYLEYVGTEESVRVNSFSFTIADVKVGETKVVTPTVAFYSGVKSESSTTTSAAYETPHIGNVTYSYTSGSGAGSQGNDFILAPNGADNYEGEVIGTISFAIDNAANHRDLTVTLSNINLTTRVANTDSDAIALAEVTEKWQVNPVYVMTVETYTPNTTTHVIPSTVTINTLYYDYAGVIYTTYDSTTFTASGNGTSTKLDVAPDLTPYYAYSTSFATYGWKVTNAPSNTDSGWTRDAEQANLDSVPNHRVGDVTVTAQYTPIDYTFKFIYNGPTIDDLTQKSGTYNVETVATTEANNAASDLYSPFTLPTVTWSGYDYKGWSATQASGSVKAYSTLWPSYTDGDYDATHDEQNAKLITSAIWIGAGAYGDVELTAIWDEAGVFTKADYGFANTFDALVLYAVPKDNYTSTDTYKYTDEKGKTSAMFIIPDARYNGEFANVNTTGPLDGNKQYVIYAFIADSSTATKGKVTIDKTTVNGSSEPATENVTVAYDGDVAARGEAKVINTADYGNVDTLLAANGGDIRASAFTPSQMRARLEADVAKAGDDAAYGVENAKVTSEAKYASIYDIKAIISKLT